MAIAIEIIIIIASIGLILAVLLQESKSEGFSGAIAGGAEQLFGQKKSKPIDKVLHRVTIGLSVILFVAGCAGIFILG